MSEQRPKSPTMNPRIDALPPAATADALLGPRADLARVIPRRRRVSWWVGIAMAGVFAILVMPAITTERWLSSMGVGKVVKGEPAPLTVRVPMFAGFDTAFGHSSGGGILIAKGETADRDTADDAAELERTMPRGPVPFIAFLLLVGVLAGLFTHHTRRSTQGRLLRVQLVSLGVIVATAFVVKLVMLTTALSVLIIPVAVFAMVPTLVLDRVVGLATGTLAALVFSFLVPFDVGVAVMLMVQAGAAGLMVAERPKRRLRAILIAGGAATLFTALTYPLMLYLSAGRLPLAELANPLHSAWIASALGPAIATALSIVLVPIYQLGVGEITQQKLVELEDLSHPLLKQIADKAPGTWQHSLTMANMAEIAANAIGANGRLVRVGAYFHDLGKSLNPKYFIENLEPGETSPHDKLAPDASCDAIFKHVTEGIVAARRAGLHERIIDFMHMHHGNGVLEYFWARCREQKNPKALTVEHFRYPGVPPQSRETAILSICDAVEAAARTLKKPDSSAIDTLVQRIVYGKLHLGQLDESGLSMGDLRRISESLRDTIRHANHGRIEYPWQKAQQDASASGDQQKLTQTGPRLDSLDRPARPESVQAPNAARSAEALAETDSQGATPRLRPEPRDSSELAMRTTAPVYRPEQKPQDSAARTRDEVSTPRDAAVAQAWRAEATKPGKDLSAELPLALSGPLPTDNDLTRPAPRQDFDETVPAPKLAPEDIVELRRSKPVIARPGFAGRRSDAEGIAESIARPGFAGRRSDAEGIAESIDDVPSLRELAGKPTSALEPQPEESDARMRRVTNPVEERRPSAEAVQFAEEAKQVLDAASKDHPAMPRTQSTTQPVDSSAIEAEIQIVHVPETSNGAPVAAAIDEPSAARKKAATLPPLRPPTVPPMGRRSPTVPPVVGNRLPDMPMHTAPPPTELRPPAPAQVPLPGMTAPPPGVVRPPGMNYLDEMITLRPQYEPRADLVVKKGDDGSVLIQPAQKPLDDSADTKPRMDAIKDDTDLNIPAAPEPDGPESSWARGLAARLDQQLEEDFGTETPVSAPTKAELQALLNSPPDPTRRQSIEEIERLHQESRERAAQSQELEFQRRGPYPTSEVDEADIEAAIELAPPARRNAIGVAKKKREE